LCPNSYLITIVQAGGGILSNQLENKKSDIEILEAPNLSFYLDYRKYLDDFYKYKRELTKKSLRPYTYQVFSAGADIKSPNYLKMVIDGKRNLSMDMVLKFAKALGLNKESTDEFKLLVQFTQENDPALRNIFLKKLNEHRISAKLKSGEIDAKTWEKLPNWISWILFAMIDQTGVEFKPDKLVKLLRGTVNEEEVRQALQAIIDSGEVEVSPEGMVVRKNNLIETPEDVSVQLVRKLQSELMYLGLESLFKDSASDREFGSATLALTKEEFEEIKFQLRKIRKQIQKDNSVKRAGTKGDKVYQLNLQLFPVTDRVNAQQAGIAAQQQETRLSVSSLSENQKETTL
jgi:uncharacterized protein (TIGR02147 family)